MNQVFLANINIVIYSTETSQIMMRGRGLTNVHAIIFPQDNTTQRINMVRDLL